MTKHWWLLKAKAKLMNRLINQSFYEAQLSRYFRARLEVQVAVLVAKPGHLTWSKEELIRFMELDLLYLRPIR